MNYKWVTIALISLVSGVLVLPVNPGLSLGCMYASGVATHKARVEWFND